MKTLELTDDEAQRLKQCLAWLVGCLERGSYSLSEPDEVAEVLLALRPIYKKLTGVQGDLPLTASPPRKPAA
jgi:hypothetical protein